MTIRSHPHRPRVKLGLSTGYWSAGPPPGIVEQIATAERLGFDSLWTSEAYGSDALTPLAWWGAVDDDAAPRHGDRPAVGAHAHRHGDGGDDPRSPQRRPLRARPRRVRPAGGGGLVRPALPAPARPHPRVRRHRAPDDRPRGARSPTTASSTRCPTPAAPASARRSSRRSTRCAPTSRSCSAPRGRRTSPSPPRSPTAGCRSGSHRRATRSTATPWRRGSPVPAADTSRSTRSRCVDPAGARRRRRRGLRRLPPADARPLHRRDGRQGRQLPLRRLRPHGLRGRVRADPSSSTSPGASRRRSPPCRWRWWRTSPSSARRTRSAPSCRGGGTTCVTTFLVQGPPPLLEQIAELFA